MVSLSSTLKKDADVPGFLSVQPEEWASERVPIDNDRWRWVMHPGEKYFRTGLSINETVKLPTDYRLSTTLVKYLAVFFAEIDSWS